MRPAVFLDRDDTVCRNADLPGHAWGGRTPGDLLDPDHVHALPGVGEALERLRALGFAIVVITNQGGVARAGGSLSDIDACHDALRAQLPLNPPDRAPQPIARSLIDACYSAPHHPSGVVSRFADEHHWRKPGPGMVLAAARELGLDLSRSWMVGDKQRDLDCATAAGIDPERTIRVDPGSDTPDLPAACERIARALAPHAPTHAIRVEHVTLRSTLPGAHPLRDPRVRETVAAAARGIAERTGVALVGLALSDDAVTATIATHRLGALAFMGELRRTTNAWHARAHGSPLWPDA